MGCAPLRSLLAVIVLSSIVCQTPASAASTVQHPCPCMDVSLAAHAASSTDAALVAMGAPEWHAAGYRGAGVRVGVIDLGFYGYTSLLGTELPVNVHTMNLVDGQEGQSVDGGTRYGTAVAEIIHDVAPDAQLYLARIATTDDLVEAVDWLLAEDVQIINTSLGWYGVSPGDATGLLADEVARARASDALWVTEAGDAGRRHWSGDWSAPQNGDSYPFTTYGRMNWLLADGEYEVPAGTRLDVYLRWSDWGAADQDYDLYLWEYTSEDPVPRAVASGTNPQTGLLGQTPTESLSYITQGEGSMYAVSIHANNVSHDAHLELFLVGEPLLQYRVTSQSLTSPGDAPLALTVAAVSPTAPYDRLADSSEGPTNGPGGIGSGGLRKPDLAGYGSATTASLGAFEGTAAATPYVSGAAALVLGRYPDLAPDEVETFLIERARPHIGQDGHDPAYGHGRVYLGEDPNPPTLMMYLPLLRR